jgi:hypothetical protein
MRTRATPLAQRAQQQLDHLEVGLGAGVTVELGAHLQRLAGGQRAGRSGMQHAAGVAQPHDARAVEQVRVDARDLRRDVARRPIVRPDSWSTSLNVASSRSRPLPVSSDSMYSINGGITSS